MMSYIDALDVFFQIFNMHLVAMSPIVNKAPKLWYFPNLVQSFLVNDQFISVNCLLHDKCFRFAGVYGVNTYLVRQLLWRDLSFLIKP